MKPPPRWLLLATGAALIACSDPEFPPELAGSDPTGKADDPGGTPAPAPPGDGGPAPSQQLCKSEGWSCSELGACSAACGIDLSCVNACKGKGCPAAQQAFTASMDCAQAKCLGACLTGMSKGCEDCVKASCASQAKACDVAACPQVCTTVPSSDGAPAPGTPDGGAGPGPTQPPPQQPAPTPASPQGCSSIFDCVKGCGMRIGPCVSDCRAKGCAAAMSAYDALSACADQKCVVDCLFPFVPTCTSCLLTSCSATWSSCAASSC